MSVKQYNPAIKYGNAVSSDEVDLSGTTGDVTFTAGNPVTGTVSVSALNPAIGQTVTKSLTAANIAAMYGAPIEVIPAPGAGKLIVVDSWVFSMTPTTTSFTGGGVVSLIYNTAASTAAAGTLPSVNVTTGVAGASNPYLIFGASNTSQAAPPVANASVVITNATAAFATGTGTAKVIANYQIITL